MNKAAFFKMSYGLYVVGSCNGDEINAQIANTAFQVTSDPSTIAVSLNKQNLTHDYVQHSRKFSISVLAQSAPMELIGRFGFKTGRDTKKFDGVQYRLGVTGVPILLDHTVACFEAEVTKELDCGTHTIFTGNIVECDVLSDEAPMTYAYYHEVKKGKSPKTAPTYQSETVVPPPVATATRYVCGVCGYVYDPEKGDPDGGIAPGTRFEDLPATWVCPICGAGKEEFSPEA
jgi:flavin reductase (DIM6/NTAB) family NADH-FMN oxidoreductase RutF/rubredoxin